VKNDIQRLKEIGKAVQILRQRGIRVGLPMQTANGEMIFPVDDNTISAAQILELLDKDELDGDGVRKFLK
jgi:hypothetical protein